MSLFFLNLFKVLNKFNSEISELLLNLIKFTIPITVIHVYWSLIWILLRHWVVEWSSVTIYASVLFILLNLNIFLTLILIDLVHWSLVLPLIISSCFYLSLMLIEVKESFVVINNFISNFLSWMQIIIFLNWWWSFMECLIQNVYRIFVKWLG